jgi:hypothetical protein
MEIKLPPGGNLEQIKRIEAVAITLMAKHGLRPGQAGGWSFKWGNAAKVGGTCSYKTRTLRFSAPLFSLWTTAQAVDLIKHEIAHALAGEGHHHDEIWWKIARDIGATGSRCWGKLGEKSIPPTWKGTCPKGHVRYAYRKPKQARCCGICSPHVFDARYIRKWEPNQ